MLPLIALLLACANRTAPEGVPGESGHFVLAGGTVVGLGPADVEVRDGRIVAVGEVSPAAERVDVSGRYLAPAVIDSHVHLAYLPEADAMADGGVAGAVDLAAPLPFLASLPSAPRVRASGPMVTAVGGYPTQSWGADGYGLEVSTATEAAEAVRALRDAGAGLIKLPITSGPGLDEATLAAAVAEAHANGLQVASHAMTDAEAARAAAAGVDLLAHTPTSALSEATLDAWAGRAVVSTLRAFGGSATAVANLSSLRERGATVLYGTDFGNTRTAGVDALEIELLIAAGLDGAAILEAMTSAPAERWGWADLGRIEAGAAASLLVLSGDPLEDPRLLAAPEQVWIDGALRTP